MMNERLQQIIVLLEKWLPSEATIAFANEEGLVEYIKSPFQKEAHLVSHSVAYDIIKKKKTIEAIENSYYVIGYPIQLDEEKYAILIILPNELHIKSQKKPTIITGRSLNCWYPISFEQISYFESYEKKTWFTANEQQYESIYKLKELDHLLPDFFLRVHRSFIINVHYIKEISRDFQSKLQIKMTDGTMIPVSQTYTLQLRQTLGF